MKNILTAVLLISGILWSCSEKGSKTPLPIEIENAAVLEVPSVQKTTAAFMNIKNNSSDDDFLIGAETDAAEVCELHEMVMEGEVMRMQKLDSVEIPEGKSIELKRGGIHLMLIHLKKEIKAGESIKLKLLFKNSNEIEMMAVVRTMDEIN